LYETVHEIGVLVAEQPQKGRYPVSPAELLPPLKRKLTGEEGPDEKMEKDLGKRQESFALFY